MGLVNAGAQYAAANRRARKILSYVDGLIKEKEEAVVQVARSADAKSADWIASEGYKKINPQGTPSNLVAKVDFKNGSLNNALNSSQRGKMDRQFAPKQFPKIVEGFTGKGLEFDGDAWLDLNPIGIFKRNEPFSIGIRVKIPEDLENGVIFHKNYGTRLHSYRGYHLGIKENKIRHHNGPMFGPIMPLWNSVQKKFLKINGCN